MKRGHFGLILMLFAVFAMSFGSASIFVGQPDSTYNLGDDFNLSASIMPQIEVNDYAVATLVIRKIFQFH
jgi:Na+/pantothenate symporter